MATDFSGGALGIPEKSDKLRIGARVEAFRDIVHDGRGRSSYLVPETVIESEGT